jgi:hypothetical protein
MAYGFLAQLSPSASVLSDLYTCPNNTKAVVQIIVANRDTSAGLYRLSVAIDDAADSVEQYIVYDGVVDASDSLASVPISLNSNDTVRVRSSNGLISFSLTGLPND